MSSTIGISNSRAPDAHKFELGRGNPTAGTGLFPDIQEKCFADTLHIKILVLPPFQINYFHSTYVLSNSIPERRNILQDPKIAAIEFKLSQGGTSGSIFPSLRHLLLFQLYTKGSSFNQKAYLMWESRGRPRSSTPGGEGRF
ncbi:uncharacterized protein [Typha angustifolia]|uniref:uncharacterized protein isoform X2 n=1 Tax=Typha angustifolia TaxID=59011 RepID=UPI003C30CC72